MLALPVMGVTLLYRPSICTRFIQMDVRRSQVLRPFPTPGFGTLWVAGEPLRDRRVSCLPRWTVCPTRSPSLGSNRSTCRGECSLSGPLATPPGQCHHGPLTNGPRRIPPYCLSSVGSDTVTGRAPKLLRPGPLPASPLGLSCPDPPPALPAAVPPPPAAVYPPGRAAPLVWGPLCLPSGSRCVRGLVLACSLCPPSHRHDARQIRVWVVVGVARACAARMTCKVHNSKHDRRRGLCPRVPPPPPRTVAPVPAPCFSHRPWRPSRRSRLCPWLCSGLFAVCPLALAFFCGGGGGVCSGAPPPAHAACCGHARCVAAGCVIRCLALGRGRAGHTACCACLALLSRSCTRCSGRPPRCLFPFRPVTVVPGGGGGVGGGRVVRLFYSAHLVVPTAGGVYDASTMRARCEAQSPVPGLLGGPLLPCLGASPPGRTVCCGRARCEAIELGSRRVM